MTERVFESLRVEEFYNSCHAKSDGKFCGTGGATKAGPGGSSSGAARKSTVASDTASPTTKPLTLKKGQRKTIKGDNGENIGLVSRTSRGLEFKSKNGYVSGYAKNVDDAIAKLKLHAPRDAIFGARTTRPENRTAEQKATIAAQNKDYRDKEIAKKATSGLGSSLIKQVGGPVKASQVSVGRDGTAKVSGQSIGFKITKGTNQRGQSGHLVPAELTSNGSSKWYRTQAGAKSAVARHLTALASNQT